MRYHRLVKSFFDFNSQDSIVNSPFPATHFFQISQEN